MKRHSKSEWWPGQILDSHPANGRRRYKVMPSLIGWAQTCNKKKMMINFDAWELL